MKLALRDVFEGNSLTVSIWNDQPVWLASEISLALGYARSDIVSKCIRDRWFDEFVENKHYFILSVGEYIKFETTKMVVHPSELKKTRSTKIRSAVLLTEAGVDLVLLLTKKPKRWLLEPFGQKLRPLPSLSACIVWPAMVSKPAS